MTQIKWKPAESDEWNLSENLPNMDGVDFVTINDVTFYRPGVCRWKNIAPVIFRAGCNRKTFLAKRSDHEFCPFCGRRIVSDDIQSA